MIMEVTEQKLLEIVKRFEASVYVLPCIAVQQIKCLMYQSTNLFSRFTFQQVCCIDRYISRLMI